MFFYVLCVYFRSNLLHVRTELKPGNGGNQEAYIGKTGSWREDRQGEPVEKHRVGKMPRFVGNHTPTKSFRP